MENAFGELIRQKRESLGIKAYELAQRMGRQPSLVSRLENQDFKETPPADVIAALSGVLDIPQYVILRSLGYDVGPTTGNESPPSDLEREALIATLRRVRLTPKRIVALEGILSMFLDAAADDLAEHRGGIGNSGIVR